ncbi:MAG: chaperone NapD [Candidatus Accumulibacter sp.]|uniref:chaperone NapD n=1 Tax=Accumulibacter sp. TaxID=2053492 RepID=UPI0025F1B324|nr:chaperone NapD [Accumulibacter sp.]MCP5249458.1 chaperone NapD [Accumulibacter sp.]
MNISSVLVNARPEVLPQVQGKLLALSGVEVHAATDKGQLIVTIEADSDRAAADMFTTISRQPGVLSAALVYHQFEPDPDEEA